VIYLAHTVVAPDAAVAEGLADDAFALTEGLLAVDTDLTRSKLYHGLKRLQPADVPLLVAEVADPPKLKGMEPGALAWFRDRLDR
jgi:hypothetical protein